MTKEDREHIGRLLKCPNSLEDFLKGSELTVDGVLDDGWGEKYAVKGCEIEAAILFADISGFSARTQDLSSIETLAFINHFIAWVSAEALGRHPVIVDKYIGDELMLVFSNAFGSEDAVADAIDTARWMSEHDVISFRPHVGIAAGRVTVGYTGTRHHFDCSVFGSPVTYAKRCADVPPQEFPSLYGGTITMPASLMADRDFGKLFPRLKYDLGNGRVEERDQTWKMLEPRSVKLKNLPETKIVQCVNTLCHFPCGFDATTVARANIAKLRAEGKYRA